MLPLHSWLIKFSRNHLAIIHAIHHTNHNRNFWRRKKKTNNFPSGLSFSHRFKQLLAAAVAAAVDVAVLWCVAPSASRNLDFEEGGKEEKELLALRRFPADFWASFFHFSQMKLCIKTHNRRRKEGLNELVALGFFTSAFPSLPSSSSSSSLLS